MTITDSIKTKAQAFATQALSTATDTYADLSKRGEVWVAKAKDISFDDVKVKAESLVDASVATVSGLIAKKPPVKDAPVDEPPVDEPVAPPPAASAPTPAATKEPAKKAPAKKPAAKPAAKKTPPTV